MSTNELPAELGPDQLRERIERTRGELGQTVDALAAKADVKGRARERVQGVTDTVKGRVGELRDRATGLTGAAREKASELTGSVKDRASTLTGTVHDTAVGVRDKAVEAAPTSRHRSAADAETVLLDAGAARSVGANDGAHVAGGTSPSGTSPSGTSPSGTSQVRERVSAALGSVAGAASGAAAGARARITGATVGGRTDQTDAGANVAAPGQRSTAVTAGAVAAALAVLAVLVIARQRRAGR
jgi:uncharacterized protein YjbJ (UPF0337 family)